MTHIYVVRGLLGNRIQAFATDAEEFVKPYLDALNSNELHADKTSRTTTSYEEVVERRGAELIVRLASNIEYLKICLQIIRLIDKIDFYTIDQSFINQAAEIVATHFGPEETFSIKHSALPTNFQSKVTISRESCEEAVNIFLKILMPQHFMIMNCRYYNNTIETSSELELQTRILRIKYKVFHKTALFGNHGILKNVDKDLIDHLLDRLIRRGILKKGCYLESERSLKYESYLKYFPCILMEQQQLAAELKKHDLSYKEYQQLYQESETSPATTRVTLYGKSELEKQNMTFINIHDIGQQSTTSKHTTARNDNNQNTTSNFLCSLYMNIVQ